MSHPSLFARVFRAAVPLVFLALSPLRAEIALACPQVTARSGEHCTFTAAHTDGEPGIWAWTVLEPDGGTILPGEADTAEYTAPKVTAPRIVHIQVWEDVHPPQVAIRELKVLPPAGAAPGNGLVAGWMTPKLEIYAGDPEPSPEARTARFNGIRKIAYLDDPALPGHLNHHWLVADGYGVQVVSARGEIRPWLGGKERPASGRELAADLADPEAFMCTGLAVRPQGSLASNPLHLVFCEVSLHPHYACRLYALEPGGGRRLLLGGPGVGYQDGPAAQALFGPLGDVELDREGNVFFLDRGNGVIRKLSLDGKVSTLAGHRIPGAPEFRDGKGAEAGFLDPCAMALDPQTGLLYVSDAQAIRKITPEGEVTTLLGVATAPGQATGLTPPTGGPGTPGPPKSTGLDHPEGLAIQGRNLFIADSGSCALRVLDLEGGTLHTLAGDPLEQRTRRGPLAYYSPGKAPAECAALASPHCVAFNAEGACLVGTGECVVALDMPPFRAQANPAAVPGPGLLPPAGQSASQAPPKAATPLPSVATAPTAASGTASTALQRIQAF